MGISLDLTIHIVHVWLNHIYGLNNFDYTWKLCHNVCHLSIAITPKLATSPSKGSCLRWSIKLNKLQNKKFFKKFFRSSFFVVVHFVTDCSTCCSKLAVEPNLLNIIWNAWLTLSFLFEIKFSIPSINLIKMAC